MAVSDEARICNRALLRIGQSRQITSLEEGTIWARACKAIFEDSRDVCLEAFWWPFARRRATLGAIADGERGGFAYAYTLPDDCIAPRFLEPTGTADVDDESIIGDPTGIISGAKPIPFELEDDEDKGRILLTDVEEAELVYTARITQVVRFSPLFVDALAYLLASDLAFGVAKRPAKGEAMLRAHELKITRAAALAAKARKPRARPASVFERGR